MTSVADVLNAGDQWSELEKLAKECLRFRNRRVGYTAAASPETILKLIAAARSAAQSGGADHG